MQSWARDSFQPLTTFGQLERSGRTKKDRDDANDAKIGRIIKDQSAFKTIFFLRVKHMGFWLSAWVTLITGKDLTIFMCSL